MRGPKSLCGNIQIGFFSMIGRSGRIQRWHGLDTITKHSRKGWKRRPRMRRREGWFCGAWRLSLVGLPCFRWSITHGLGC
jgi:hypothetical protein